MFVCNECKRIIIQTDRRIECENASLCGTHLHGKCASLSENELKTGNWKCESCLKKSDKSEILFIGNSSIIKNDSNPKKLNYCKKCAIAIAIVLILALAFALFSSILISRIMPELDAIDVTDDFNACYVNKTSWAGSEVNPNIDRIDLPVQRIIIEDTFTDPCYSSNVCKVAVEMVQESHIYSYGWEDIAFNFLIGGDGCVYEGRGWDYQGAHAKGYNEDSYGIAFIGSFKYNEPTDSQIEAAKRLLADGVSQQKISPDYQLYGSRQLKPTSSPGDALYKIITTWPHFSTSL